MYLEKLQKIFDSEIPESQKGNEIIKIYSGLILDISSMPFDDKKSFLSWIHKNVSTELAERLQQIFLDSYLVNDDQLMQILGLLTGSGMQTMMMVAIQVESIKAMTKHREKLLESFTQKFKDVSLNFDVDLKLATKSMVNEISKNTNDIFKKVVDDSSEKLTSDFNQKISDFDNKVNTQITVLNKSLLAERTAIALDVKNLTNTLVLESTNIKNALFSQRDETIKAMDSSSTEFHNRLVDAFNVYNRNQTEIQTALNKQIDDMEKRALNKVAENLNGLVMDTFKKLTRNINIWVYVGAPVLISLFTTGLAIKFHLFS